VFISVLCEGTGKFVEGAIKGSLLRLLDVLHSL
jgi:hypothetical protein